MSKRSSLDEIKKGGCLNTWRNILRTRNVYLSYNDGEGLLCISLRSKRQPFCMSQWFECCKNWIVWGRVYQNVCVGFTYSLFKIRNFLQWLIALKSFPAIFLLLVYEVVLLKCGTNSVRIVGLEYCAKGRR